MSGESDVARVLLSPPPAGTEADALLRSSLAAILVGSAYPAFHDPLASDSRAHLQRSGLDGMSSAILLASLLGSAGGGSDLDALDVGPAHLAVPATAAAIAAVTSRGVGDVPTSVAFGCTVGARLRAAHPEAVPGEGLHTVSSFGLVAAVSAAGAALGLDESGLNLALCIALDRAAGFAVNNNSTDLGITHFGWAAAHGVEAAWLAGNAVSASADLEAALARVFGKKATWTETDFARIDAHQRTVYKAYPVNVYLNELFRDLSGRRHDDPARVRVVIPPIPRLALEAPSTPRELRNSVRGVAALALSGEPSFEAFTAEGIEGNRAAILDWTDRIDVVLDPGRPTELTAASLEVALIDDGGRERSHELAIARPGTWDGDGLESLLISPVSRVDGEVLHAIVHGTPAEEIASLIAHVLHTESTPASLTRNG